MSAFQELVLVQQDLTDSRKIVELVGQPLRRHEIRVPGLIEQLYMAATDPSLVAEEGGSRMKPKSKPPLAVEAWSRFQDVDRAVRRWVRSVRITEHSDLSRCIRELVGAAAGQRGYLAWDEETTEALLLEMRSWRTWAAILTGWESAPWRPYIHCPVCEGVSTIWVNMTVGSAYCASCKFDWDDARKLADQVAA